mgnify:FL=1
MIVIDASALASFILLEPGWERIAPYIKHCMSVDHVVKEVTNTIWKAYITERISRKDAEEKHRALMRLVGVNIKLYSEEQVISDAFKLSMKLKLPIYDTLYIALAKKLKLPLLTLDLKQKRKAEEANVKTITP